MPITDNTKAEMILGARVWFARQGANADGQGTNKVAADKMPELPTSYAEPGNWVCLGKIRTAKPQTDYKTADVEGVDDTGAYKVTELKLATKRKLQFSTNDITKEAFELTFGLLKEITSSGEQAVFASGSDTIEGWLVLELTDAYRTVTGLAQITLWGKLSMQNPLEAKSDPALAEYNFDVVPNDLAKFTEAALVSPGK